MSAPPLADRSLKRLLEEVAAATPAPGGGCAAAWTCAFAASLVEMTAAVTIERPDGADRREHLTQVGGRARELREQATELGQRELDAYAPVLVALRLPKDDPDRPAQLDAALSAAAETPLAVARVAAELTALGLDAARSGTPHLRGDALTGALLAEGACQAAARLVAINLEGRPGDERLAELAELTKRAAAIRADVR